MKEKKPMSPLRKRILLRRAVAFPAILAVTVILLTLIHLVAGALVRSHDLRANRALMQTVMPQADAFSELIDANVLGDDRIEDMQAAYNGRELLGYCVTAAAFGFRSDISVLVGVDVNGEVTGVTLLEEDETPGIGDGVRGESFLGQFTGASGTLSLGSGHNSVSGISGATKSAQAVVQCVNVALAAVANLDEGGGYVNEEQE